MCSVGEGGGEFRFGAGGDGLGAGGGVLYLGRDGDVFGSGAVMKSQ
jgi:hypothetical protein